MVRVWSSLYGAGLTLLWLAGMFSPAPRWFAWLDAVAALCAYGGAAISPSLPPSYRVTGPLALAAGLFGLWIAGLAARVPPWQAWWTFVFAFAFLVLGVGASLANRRSTPTTSAV